MDIILFVQILTAASTVHVDVGEKALIWLRLEIAWDCCPPLVNPWSYSGHSCWSMLRVESHGEHTLLSSICPSSLDMDEVSRGEMVKKTIIEAHPGCL